MSLAPGSRIGPYEVLAAIGAGGMGEVYRATDSHLKRPVAIKVLRAAVAGDPDRLARFQREAEVLAALNHPNIAAIYGLERTPDVTALVMELVEGEDFAERIAHGAIPIDEALPIAKQIADALEAAHDQGIIHRDLKPANIKIRPDGAVKVLDFGLAKAVEPVVGSGSAALTNSPTITSPARLTAAGNILGTAAYMSPEQARGKAVDKRADIWAFGCVLYEMLTGTRAFGGQTVSDTIAAVLEREPDWSALPASTPPAMIRVLQQCLQKDVRLRRRDIGDIQLDLQDSAAARSITPASVGRAARSRLPVRLVYGALVVGGVVASVMYLARPAPVANAPEPIELSILPPAGTVFPTEIGAPWPSISPDGRQLVFVALNASGAEQLWLRRLDSESPHLVEHTDGAVRPFWSPDGRAIGFFADGKIKRVDVPNGVAQVICDAPYLGGMSASWGSQGTIVFIEEGGVFTVPASGGTPHVLHVTPQSGSGRQAPQNPSFLPDGRRFIFVEQASKREDDRVCIGSLDETPPQCVATLASPVRYAAPGYLLYVRDGVLRLQPFSADRLALSGESTPISSSFIRVDPVYRPPPFSISERALAYHPGTAKSQLAWIDRTGRVVSVVGEGSDLTPAVSRDGSRLMVARADPQHAGNFDLWLRDSSLQTWSRFTFDPGDTSAVFSPDGTRVAYASQRDGSSHLIVKATNGLAPEQELTHFPPGVSAAPVDWSSDGRSILYSVANLATSWDVGIIPADGTGAPKLVLNGPSGERNAALSPDMKWIAYDSTESGGREIWIQPMPPNGTKWQVSTGGAFAPTWRGDGRELFYLTADGKMMAVAITPGQAPTLGTVTPLFQTLKREGAGGFRVSPDGQQFLINGPPDLANTDPITVIVNWQSAIPR